MSTGPTPLPEPQQQGPGRRRRWLPRLRDIRIRSKLALILVVPIAAVVALAAARIVAIGQSALEANLLRSLTVLSADVSALTQDLHRERVAAAQFLSNDSSSAESYNLRIRSTDQRIAAYQEERSQLDDLPASVESRLKAIDAHLAALNGLRQEVLDRKQMPVAEVVLRYGVVLNDLVAYGEAVGQLAGEGEIADSLRALAAFARAKAGTAEEQAVIFAAISSGQLNEEQYSSFVATLTSQQEAFQTFTLTASPQQRALVENVVTGDAVVLADQVSTEVARSVGQRPTLTAEEAAVAIGAVNDLMRWAEIQLERDLLAQVDQLRSDVIRQAVIESAAVVATLVVAIALAVALARSLNYSLRRLREGALAVAQRDLPEAVARLRDMRDVDEGSVAEIVREVRDPIRLSNRDEVGQVAQAFNIVHHEAVRIAAEQAALRTSVSAMFLNLARRSQALVDRMIGELDAIERDEEDPKRLAKLFELDHLATRMRRNDENLLVLAGADSTAPRREDALLIDVLRAAQSEVEHYNRIEFGTVDTDISIAAHAVNDVVRLLAELLDNATRFSPPTTMVIADGRRIRDYVIVQVEDRGLGLSDEQLETLNRRLAEPPEMDVSAFRLMGLAVVSRLAARYGIQVELRRGVGGGTVAQVTLPSSIVILPMLRSPEPVLPRPRQPLAVESGPRTSPRTQAGWPTSVRPVDRTVAASGEQWAPTPTRWEQSRPGFSTPAPAQTGPQSTRPSPTVVHQLSPAVAPRIELPSGPVAGLGAALAATAPYASPPPQREDAAEMPIFREVEAVWFRTHGQDVTQVFTMPSSDDMQSGQPGGASSASTATLASSRTSDASPTHRLPNRTSGQAAPPTYPAGTASTPSAVSHSAPSSARWRTAADEGWERASRAAAPTTAGTTASGLPKRIPQAQLVPGGVEVRTSQERTRRTPEEVRGLLSAYHRGVQRGRSVGSEQYGNATREHSR